MRDKHETKERVLEAACEVFAEKGYRDATVQDICSAAGANVAAVNYYFGTKRGLYLAVWQHLYNVVQQQYLGKVVEIADPTARLREIIHQRVKHAFDDGPAGRFRKMIQAEVGDPTEVHDELRARFLDPLMDLLTGTVAAILDTSVNSPVVRRCAFSVQSQLVSLARLRRLPGSTGLHRLMGVSRPGKAQIEEVAEHIVNFVMGGIRAARRATPNRGGRRR